MSARASLAPKLARVKMVLTDVDGVLTDGALWVGAEGHEQKRFHVLDGMSVWLGRTRLKLRFGVISGRESEATQRRMSELRYDVIYQGREPKGEVIARIAAEQGLALDEIAFIGDDVNDLAALGLAGFSACPRDACVEVRTIVDYVCRTRGGDGVLREIVELLTFFRTPDVSK